MLYANGVEESEVTLESIGFNQVEALATDQVDLVVGYAANEPVVLRWKGYDLTEWRTSEYVQLASNGIVTNETLLAENPEMIQAFIGAILKGIQDTIRDPDASVKFFVNDNEYLEGAEIQRPSWMGGKRFTLTVTFPAGRGDYRVQFGWGNTFYDNGFLVQKL